MQSMVGLPEEADLPMQLDGFEFEGFGLQFNT